MDRIETAEDPNSRENSPEVQPTQTGPSRPALATLQTPGRPRAPSASARSRRPSIRLSRFPSASSLNGDQDKQQQLETQAGPSLQRQVSIRSPVAEEDESPVGGRRRSSSEPRPGRWSSPPESFPRVATPMHLMPLSEESSRQSPLPTPQGTGAQETETSGEELEEPAPTLQPPRSMLRRTSQAALRPFTRNRASTVTGVPPTAANMEQQEPRINEYGPHVVDVLDVIGKLTQPMGG